jgi:hypothetical protein
MRALGETRTLAAERNVREVHIRRGTQRRGNEVP